MASSLFGRGDRTAEAIANMTRREEQEKAAKAEERQERAAYAAGRRTRRV